MASKTTIHEICTKCGKLAAWQDSDGTVHVNAHKCSDPPISAHTFLRSFRPGEVIFVPMSEPLTDDELNELEQWGTHLSHSFHFSRSKALRIASTIKALRAKNKRLSSDFREMASDCARLQKVLLDIGYKVRDVLGVDISKEVSSLRKGSWQCHCGVRSDKIMDSCCNCGRSKQ